MKDTHVEITTEMYDRLIESEAKLEALECAGVDNWCGYGEAMTILHGDD
jgi:hypothetical protein